MKPEQIREDLEKKLSPERMRHTISVMYTSASLAMCHQADVKKALLAGLLHDCTKYLTPEEHKCMCRDAGIELTDIEDRNHHLLHAKTGAIAAKMVYGVDDEEILDAIRQHTTGRGDMSILEKIIFTADYIEPGRRGLKGIEEIRYLAWHDLDLCICKISENTLRYLESKKASIDPRTKETYEFYKNL